MVEQQLIKRDKSFQLDKLLVLSLLLSNNILLDK